MLYLCLALVCNFLFCGLTVANPFDVSVIVSKDGDTNYQTADFTGYVKPLFDSIVDSIKSGVPEIGMPVLDPVDVNPHGEIIYEFKRRRNRLHFTLARDFKLYGLSKMKLTNHKSIFDPYKMILDIQFDYEIPQLFGTGQYKTDGRLVWVPIRGRGQANFTCQDVTGAVKVLAHVDAKKEQFEAKFVDLDLNCETVRFSLENFIDPGLTKAANSLLNIIGKRLFDRLISNNEAMLDDIAQHIKAAINNYVLRNLEFMLQWNNFSENRVIESNVS